MRTRGRLRVAAAAAVAAAGAVVAAVALTGGADDAPSSGGVRVAWAGTPQVVRPAGLPRDRVVVGRVRNEALRAVTLDVDGVRIVDARGRALPSTARFAQTFVRGRFPPGQPDIDPRGSPTERTRLGQRVRLRPNETAPLTLSWRVPAGRAAPVRVDLGPVSLPLPR